MSYANVHAFAAAVLFGIAAVAVRVAVQDIAPSTVAVYRYGQGALLLLIALAAGARHLLQVRVRDLVPMAVLGALYFTLFPLAYNAGLQQADVSRGSLMLATVPMWSALFGRLTGEHLHARQRIGLALSLAGVCMVLVEQGLSWDGGVQTLVGCAWVLVAAIVVAAYGVAYNRLSRGSLARYQPLTVTVYGMAFGTMLTMPVALADDLATSLVHLKGPTAVALLYLGVLGGAVAITLWNAALQQLSPTRVAVYLQLNPVVATLAGAMLLGESVSVLFIASFVVVVGGVTLVNAPGPTAGRLAGVRLQRPSTSANVRGRTPSDRLATEPIHRPAAL